MVLLAHTHHGSFILRDAVGWAGKTLLLPGGHLVGAGGTCWRGGKKQDHTDIQHIRMCWKNTILQFFFFPFFVNKKNPLLKANTSRGDKHMNHARKKPETSNSPYKRRVMKYSSALIII